MSFSSLPYGLIDGHGESGMELEPSPCGSAQKAGAGRALLMSRGLLPIILSGGLLEMNTTIPTTNVLHVHYWVETGHETNLDDSSIAYKCTICNKVKKQ
jgi:hypothetical protein